MELFKRGLEKNVINKSVLEFNMEKDGKIILKRLSL